jgi:hypothetical protein
MDIPLLYTPLPVRPGGILLLLENIISLFHYIISQSFPFYNIPPFQGFCLKIKEIT